MFEIGDDLPDGDIHGALAQIEGQNRSQQRHIAHACTKHLRATLVGEIDA